MERGLILAAALALAACSSDPESTTPAANADAGGEIAIEVDGGAPSADTGAPSEDSGTFEDTAIHDTTDASEAGPSCAAARDAAIGPIAKVSTGDVAVLEEADGVRRIYVDASAGGTAASKTNPWLYLDLADAKRVEIDDPAAFGSAGWDLAIKRPILRANGGDSGAGVGGAAFLKDQAFDAVTDAAAKAATIATEDWFDATCTLSTDATGAVKTAFDGWYEYDGATMKLTPAAGTWVVKGGDGALYKLAIESYYANPDGTPGATSGRYVLKVAAVK